MSKHQDKFITSFKPRNPTQKAFESSYLNYDIHFLLGPAGCGKGHAAIALALRELSTDKSKKTLYIIRPPVEASSRSLGFLPGDLSEKLLPFSLPVFSLLPKIAFNIPPGLLQTYSLAHSRGITFEDCIVLIDECQNLTTKEFILLISRLGPNARLLFCGDPDQSDIRATPGHSFITDLDYVVDCLFTKPGINIVEFSPSEIVRHPRLHLWLSALQQPSP